MVVLEIDTDVVYVGVPGVLVELKKDDTVRLGISVGVIVTLFIIEIVFEILVVGELERRELLVTQTVGVYVGVPGVLVELIILVEDCVRGEADPVCVFKGEYVNKELFVIKEAVIGAEGLCVAKEALGTGEEL